MKRLKCILIIAIIFIELFSLASCLPARKFQDRYSFEYFDTITTLSGYAASEKEYEQVTDKIFAELEICHKLFDIYNIYEGINNLYTVNAAAGNGEWIRVDSRIIGLLSEAKQMYEKTDGEMNVAMGSVLSLWHNARTAAQNSPEAAALPDFQALTDAAIHTDIDKLLIDKQGGCVMLDDSEMSLDVGAFAKGYAVECAAKLLDEQNISGYSINVGGNIRVVGNQGNGKPWDAGVDNPSGGDDNPYYARLTISNQSLVTSGTNQRYYIVNNKTYHHIIDKDTLMPAEGYKSVTILTKSSATADGLSTALFCMSIEDGKQALLSFPDTHAMWVDTNGNITYSDGFAAYLTDKK